MLNYQRVPLLISEAPGWSKKFLGRPLSSEDLAGTSSIDGFALYYQTMDV